MCEQRQFHKPAYQNFLSVFMLGSYVAASMPVVNFLSILGKPFSCLNQRQFHKPAYQNFLSVFMLGL